MCLVSVCNKCVIEVENGEITEGHSQNKIILQYYCEKDWSEGTCRTGGVKEKTLKIQIISENKKTPIL